MPSITLSVPEEVRKLMKKHSEVNWSALIRKTITEKTDKLEMKEKLLEQLEKDREFDEWAVNLGRKARRGRLKRLLKDSKNEVNS